MTQQQQNELERRVARVEEEVDALNREVEALREEMRSFARLVGRGEIAVPESTS